MASRFRKKLGTITASNVLENHLGNIDTWPYVEMPEVSEEMKSEREREITRIRSSINFKTLRLSERIQDSTKNLKDKQLLVVSWFLAAVIGVLGNFIVNLFFGSVNFNFASIYLLLFATTIFLFAVYMFFTYYPPNLSFLIAFQPECHSYIYLPTVNENELNPKAKSFMVDRDAFTKTMMQYINIVILAILRDSLKRTDLNVLAIAKVTNIHPGTQSPSSESQYTLPIVLPSYELTIEFKSWHYFWHRKKIDQARNELNIFANYLSWSMHDIMPYSVDANEENWQEKGVSFLNKISNWNFEDMTNKLENQIKEI